MASTNIRPAIVQIKAKLGEDVRRLTVPVDASFDVIRAKLAAIFSTQAEYFVIKYEDSDGDQITLSSDEEVQEAIRQALSQASPAQQLLRLTIVKETPRAPLLVDAVQPRSLLDTPIGVAQEPVLAAAPPPPVPAPAQDDFVLVDESHPTEQFTPPTPLPVPAEPVAQDEQPDAPQQEEPATSQQDSAQEDQCCHGRVPELVRSLLDNAEFLQAVDDLGISGPLYHALPHILASVLPAAAHCCSNQHTERLLARLLPEVLPRVPHIGAVLARSEVRQALQQHVPQLAAVLYQYLDSTAELWSAAAAELSAVPPAPFNFFTLLPLLRFIAPLLPTDVDIDIPTEVPAAAAFQRHIFPGCGRLWDFVGHMRESFFEQPSATPESARAQDGDAVHAGVTCDGCGAHPIVGVRYNCTVCHDFDLCAKCEATGQHDERHPLIKLNRPKGPVVHQHVSCDGCNMSPIVGPRFKCTVCNNFDLCAQCEASGQHDPEHPMIKMAVPQQRGGCPRFRRPFCGGGRQGSPFGAFGARRCPVAAAAWCRGAEVPPCGQAKSADPQPEPKQEPTPEPKRDEGVPVLPTQAPAAVPVVTNTAVPAPVPAPVPVAPALPPRVPSLGAVVEEQLKQLADMGFVDRNTNVQLLRRFNGNVQLVVNSLLGV